MALLIRRRETGSEMVIELHGRLSAAGVPEFESVCAATNGPFRVYLGQLTGADLAGLTALRSKAAAGVRLEGASPYIELLLERSGIQ